MLPRHPLAMFLPSLPSLLLSTFLVINTLTPMVISVPVTDFTMSLSPPPQPGSRFNISWAPALRGIVTLTLNGFASDNIQGGEDDGNSQSGVIANGIENSGSYIWDVPSTLCGTHSISLSGDVDGGVITSNMWDGVPCSGQATPSSGTITLTSTPTGTGTVIVSGSTVVSGASSSVSRSVTAGVGTTATGAGPLTTVTGTGTGTSSAGGAAATTSAPSSGVRMVEGGGLMGWIVGVGALVIGSALLCVN